MLDFIGEAVLIADATSKDMPIVYVNEAFERLSGYRADEVIGRNCRFLQGPLTEVDAVQSMRQAIAEGRSLSLEMWNYRRNGELFRNHLTVSPLYDEGGRLVQFVGVQRDVTAARAQSEQWALSQRLATVGQLTAGIAHDLNNLVTGILGTAELLVTQVQGQPAASDTAAALRDAARLAAAQLRRLTSLGRRHPGQPCPIELPALFDHLLRFLRPTLPASMQLEAEVAPGAEVVWTEPVQLEAALLNLVINARDALPGASGNVRLSARARPDGHVELCVADDGCGMDSATLARAEDAFFTTKPAGQGTGLGLTMVRDFVQNYGAALQISSAPDQGTRVSLILPTPELAERSNPGSSACASAPSPSALEKARPVGALRVALVDDDLVVRIAARFMLEHLGHQVMEFESAEPALQALADDACRIDLLITDLRMPGTSSGLDILAAAQRLRPALPRILASASAAELQSELPPATAILTKPFAMEDVARAIQMALAQARAWSAPDTSAHVH